MSRNNSISESVDGPSQSPKIRIEARIDSDKKVAPPKEQREALPRNSRTRRNLRRFYDGGGESRAITPPESRKNSNSPRGNKHKAPHKSPSKSPKTDEQKTREKTKPNSTKAKNNEKSMLLARMTRKRGAKTQIQRMENPDSDITHSIEHVEAVGDLEEDVRSLHILLLTICFYVPYLYFVNS